ncbi:MAG: hypothetical protein HS101_15185 [Planctomycetia bacterium]|nr:hypothetical protein [Planctomycetia bacterium]MCC7313844.1 hypothetical protein [Planctomycetota bacterium]OQY97115.1 MAG: hypothetical protein B6D36_19090 [Planctomycetes bacterium UTPLA1]
MVADLTVLNDRPEYKGPASFSPSGCDPNGRCGNGLEKIYPTCAVRYGYMNYIGEFRYAPGMLFGCGGKVVIQTQRGIEIGEQVSLTCTGCDKSIKRQTMLDYMKKSGPDFYQLKSGRILRAVTPQDLIEEKHLVDGSREKILRARELARELGLDMKFVACEHIFGGERIIYHFMAEGRIDFREFVRQLAHEYHTRIEMHQVGARDEARLVADFEICGRECCCKNFLKTLRPVSMRMAKIQKATLDPSKVSGRCGRLRCCLRYEHEGYEELDKKLPRVGNRVRTESGIGTVRDRQILTQLVSIIYDDGDRIETVGVEDLLERNLPKRAPMDPAAANDANARGRRPSGRGPDAPGDRPRRDGPPPQQTPSGENQVPPPGSSTDQSVGESAQPRTGESGPAGGGEGGGNAGRDRPRGGRRRGRRGRRGGAGRQDQSDNRATPPAEGGKMGEPPPPADRSEERPPNADS